MRAILRLATFPLLVALGLPAAYAAVPMTAEEVRPLPEGSSSADRPEKLYASLKEPAPGYTLLSDSRMQAARAFGIAFRVDDATVRRYREHGIDLEAASGETHHELPVPAVFLVDPRGVIRFVHVNPDYKVRISATALLAAARHHSH